MTILGMAIGPQSDEDKAAQAEAKARRREAKLAAKKERRSGDQVIGTALQTLGPVALLAPLVVAGMKYIEMKTIIRFGEGYDMQVLVYLSGVLPLLIAKVHMHFIRVASAAETLLLARIAALEAQANANRIASGAPQVAPLGAGGTA